MQLVDFLKQTANNNKSIACMGFDPVIEKIPLKGNNEEKITKFFSEILNACESENCLPSAVKPNYAFFAQYGFDGLHALKKVIEDVKTKKIPVILDVKRGDIGKSSYAYAKEVFEFWEADATTVSPFMGFDSVKPFIEWCEKKGKGVYVLNRTSNEGAKDFQDLIVGEKKLFEVISRAIVEWNVTGNVGAVVGATSITELEKTAELFSKSRNIVPMLIPGVGRQGGSASEVSEILKKFFSDISIHRINSSSGITYAFEKNDSDDFAGSAVNALKKLNKEIKF